MIRVDSSEIRVNSLLYYLRQFDWIMVGAALSLSFLGLLTLFSIANGNDAYDFNVYKQLVFLAIAVFAMIVVGLFDYRILKQQRAPLIVFYVVSIALLAGLLFFAPSIKGVRRWYTFSFLTLDPFELVRIAVLLILAKYFTLRHIEMYRLLHIIKSGIYVAIPAFLVFLQPDFGGIVLLGGLWILILVMAGMTKKQFFILFAIGVVVGAVLWAGFFKEYQKERIINFLDPNRDPLGGGYSLVQSKIAIGSAGIWGIGWLRGPEVQYGFLPEPHTDFVFAAFVHEWGLAGAVLVIFLLFVLLWRIIYSAVNARNNFSRFVISGTAFIFLLQAVVNIAVNVGLLPVIGVPLPFMSYGGSSLVSSFILIGLLQSIRLRTPKLESAQFKNEE